MAVASSSCPACDRGEHRECWGSDPPPGIPESRCACHHGAVIRGELRRRIELQDLFAPAQQGRFGAVRRLDAAAEMQRLLMASASLNAEVDAMVAAVMGGPSDEECQRARDELVAALAALDAAV